MEKISVKGCIVDRVDGAPCKFNFDRWIWIQSVVGGRFEMVTRVRQTSNGLPAPLIKSLSFRWLLSTVARSVHAAQALKNWLLKCHGHRVNDDFQPCAIPSIDRDHFFFRPAKQAHTVLPSFPPPKIHKYRFPLYLETTNPLPYNRRDDFQPCPFPLPNH